METIPTENSDGVGIPASTISLTNSYEIPSMKTTESMEITPPQGVRTKQQTTPPKSLRTKQQTVRESNWNPVTRLKRTSNGIQNPTISDTEQICDLGVKRNTEPQDLSTPVTEMNNGEDKQRQLQVHTTTTPRQQYVYETNGWYTRENETDQTAVKRSETDPAEVLRQAVEERKRRSRESNQRSRQRQKTEKELSDQLILGLSKELKVQTNENQRLREEYLKLQELYGEQNTQIASLGTEIDRLNYLIDEMNRRIMIPQRTGIQQFPQGMAGADVNAGPVRHNSPMDAQMIQNWYVRNNQSIMDKKRSNTYYGDFPITEQAVRNGITIPPVKRTREGSEGENKTPDIE